MKQQFSSNHFTLLCSVNTTTIIFASAAIENKFPGVNIKFTKILNRKLVYLNSYSKIVVIASASIYKTGKQKFDELLVEKMIG